MAAPGITAALTTDKAGINIVQTEGYDVIIGGCGGTALPNLWIETKI